MTGLARHERDAALLARAGARGLRVPEPGELCARLRRGLLLPDAPDPSAVRWEYARWKPGQSLCLGFEIDFEDGAGAWIGWKQYVDGQGAPGADATLWSFPFDRLLPGLPRALDLRRRARDLQPLAESARLRWKRARAEVLRYKPERRAVLRLDWSATGRSHALRVLTLRAAPRCLAARRSFDFPEAPRLLGARAEHGLLYEEWLELRSAAPSAAEAGALLARLHAHPLPEGSPSCPRLSAREELDPLFGIEPSLLRRARALPLLEASGVDVWSHGDFHLDQLGLSDRGLLLLDLDSLGRAPRARDLSSWIADAFLAEPAPTVASAFDSRLEAYARAGGEPPEAPELREAVSAELVRRAAAGLRRLESGALARAQRLLDQADACLAGGRAPAAAPLERTLAAIEIRVGRSMRAAIERCDLDPRGRATLALALPEGPRWFRAGAGEPEELHLCEDARLPGSSAAQELVERGAAELVSWRPGRRFVLRLSERVRKGVRSSRYAAVVQRQEDVVRACGAASFRVARVVERDAARATFDLERLPGRALDYGQDSGQAQALARLLHEWQALQLEGLELHTRSDELELLDRLADRHARAAGSLPPGWEALFEALEPEREGGARLVTAQRDLFEAQILVERERLALLDFDLACKAEPELDPANLLAHLDLARARGCVGAREAATFEREFLGACAERQLLSARPLCFYRSASLLRLALVWGLRAGGREIARALLARAGALLDA